MLGKNSVTGERLERTPSIPDAEMLERLYPPVPVALGQPGPAH